MSSLNLTLAAGPDVKVVHVRAVESVSAPFSVVVTALCTDPSLPLSSIVGQPAKLEIVAGYAFALELGTRGWTGIVRRAEQVRALALGEGEQSHSTYRFEIVPRLTLLSLRRNHRIFQHKNIPDIVDALLAPWGVSHTWQVDRPSYPKLEFKVQYGESDLHLLTRLLEEAGITHVFEGEPDAGSRLLLSDRIEGTALRSGSPIRYVDNPSEAAELEFVTEVTWGRAVRPGARVLRDHDFRRPALALSGDSPKTQGFESALEQYLYDPGSFLVEGAAGGGTPVADDKGVARHEASYGKSRASRDLLSMRAGARTVTLETNAVDLCPGMVFSIDGHPHAGLPSSARLLVVQTTLDASLQGEWKLRVAAVPADIPYRPPQITQKPIAHGFQSGTVVGPAGEEIHTDEFGRVRVQFAWDREGKSDDNSSCWMRVHQGWGGLGYGMINLPRIGQEVLVTFLEGDPDQPVVAGRAYNAVAQVPYKLPAHKTRSTWKSDSSKGSGGFNEIMLEDLKGQELVWEQAEKDRVRLVKNDEVITVGHDRQITVKNDLEERTDGFRRAYVGKDSDFVVKQDVRERVEGDTHSLIEGHEKARIDGNLSVTVLDDRNEKVGGRYALRAEKQ
ncbi:MAG: type VI secretion system tip protein TssI/VgrG, partial [Polyangiaceae bacterium]